MFDSHSPLSLLPLMLVKDQLKKAVQKLSISLLGIFE